MEQLISLAAGAGGGLIGGNLFGSMFRGSGRGSNSIVAFDVNANLTVGVEQADIAVRTATANVSVTARAVEFDGGVSTLSAKLQRPILFSQLHVFPRKPICTVRASSAALPSNTGANTNGDGPWALPGMGKG